MLALHRAGRVPKTISTARLRMGDVLLLQGAPENVKRLEQGNMFNIFGGVEAGRLNLASAPLAVAIFAAFIAAVTLGFVSLPVGALAGAFLMLLTRCIAADEAYRTLWAFNRETLNVGAELKVFTIDLAAGLDFQEGDFYDHIHTTPSGSRRIGRFIFEGLKERMR